MQQEARIPETIKIQKIENPTISFMVESDVCVMFLDDGRVEFGEKYRDNPDAAAQEFMRIVCEQFPAFVAKVAGH